MSTTLEVPDPLSVLLSFFLTTLLSLFLVQERTRSALLESLFEELQLRSRNMMGLASGEDDKMENGSGGFFENFKVRD